MATVEAGIAKIEKPSIPEPQQPVYFSHPRIKELGYDVVRMPEGVLYRQRPDGTLMGDSDVVDGELRPITFMLAVERERGRSRISGIVTERTESMKEFKRGTFYYSKKSWLPPVD